LYLHVPKDVRPSVRSHDTGSHAKRMSNVNRKHVYRTILRSLGLCARLSQDSVKSLRQHFGLPPFAKCAGDGAPICVSAANGSKARATRPTPGSEPMRGWASPQCSDLSAMEGSTARRRQSGIGRQRGGHCAMRRCYRGWPASSQATAAPRPLLRYGSAHRCPIPAPAG
jgi:hypothetical protein